MWRQVDRGTAALSVLTNQKITMKIMQHSFARFAGIAWGLVLALSAASAAETGLYFNAEGGINIAQDVEVNGTSFELDPGVRLGVGVGWNFNKNWGVEFDTGWIWNKFKDVQGISADNTLAHHPFIVNGVYRFDTGSKFVPYVGGGIGGTYSVLDVDSGNVNDSDGDIVFAWQAMAGVRYMFLPNMSLGLGYKYHGTADSDFSISRAGNIEISGVHNHSISVVFNMTF